MRSITLRSISLIGLLLLVTPAASSAHAGHGPEHGWLAGAVQPFLSLDHMLAGAFVAVGVGYGLWCAAQAMRDRTTRTPTLP